MNPDRTDPGVSSQSVPLTSRRTWRSVLSVVGRRAGYAFTMLAALACGRETRHKSRVDSMILTRMSAVERGTLMITSEHLSDGELTAILADPRISALQELSLHHNELTAESARSIAMSPKLTDLKVLDLSFNPIGDEGVIALANSAVLLPLSRLRLGRVGASGRSAAALASSPNAAGIEELDLRYQNIGSAAALLVGRRKTLRLTHAGIDSATAVTLIGMAHVQSLYLSENSLGSLTGLDAVSPEVTHLDLTKADLSDISALQHASAPGLRALDLDYNPLGDGGLHALVQTRWLRDLDFLSVMGAKSSPAARQALRNAWGARPGLTIEAE